MPLYAFGSNDMGQLGLGESISYTHVPQRLPFFDDKQVVKIAAGKLHALALCSDNSLYSWGVNDDGALGRDGDETLPIQVPFSQTIVDICAGASYSAVLTSRGQVYACGTFKSSSGILGFQPGTKIGLRLARVQGARGIGKIRAGHNHIVMINRKGGLLTMGANESMQLGTRQRERNVSRSLHPSQIAPDAGRFVDAAAGGFHSVAVQEGGQAHGWGSNFNGQLGDGTQEPKPFSSVVELPDIVKVACGLTHSLFIDKQGVCYGSGDNSMSQLGLRDRRIIAAPQRVLAGVVDVACGGDFSIFCTGTGKLLSSGMNFSGEAGVEAEAVSEPTEIPFDFGRVKQVVCGTHFTLVLAE